VSDEQYISANDSMFGGPDESEIQARTVKVVTTRKDHPCMCGAGSGHAIPAGSRAVCDRAIVDGEWGVSYVCLPCLESWENFGLEGKHPWCEVCTPKGPTV